MLRFERLVCSLPFLLPGCQRPEHPPPAFGDYPASDTSTAILSHVVLPADTAQARWHDHLAALIGQRANFAGHYVATEWPAGWPVGHLFALADTRTGRAWVTDVDPMVGTEYRLESTLLVVDPADRVHAALDDTGKRFGDLRNLAITRYFRWDGERFVKVDSAKVYPQPPDWRMQLAGRPPAAARLADGGARPTLAATTPPGSAPGGSGWRASQLRRGVVRRRHPESPMKAIVISLVAFLALPQPAASQPGPSPDVARLFRSSVAAADRHDLRTAIAMSDSLLRQDSTVLNALWNLGIWHATLNEPRQALTAWQSYHAQDSTDWRVEAKIIQSFQALGDTARRDSALAGLLRHRSVTQNPELREAEVFCRDQSTIEGRRVMVFQTFEPRGNRMAFVTFHLLDAEGRDTARVVLGSDSLTTQFERELGRIGPAERVYTLDYFAPRLHATYAFFHAQPSYDQLKSLVAAILRGEIHPLSASTQAPQ